MLFFSFRTLVVSSLLCVFSLHAQQPWSSVTAPTNVRLNAIVYGDDRFVAVGEGGTVVTGSANGTNWTTRSSGTTRTLRGITYATSLKTFVAVGDAGTILSSPDGTTWTLRASGVDRQLNDIAWAPKRFANPNVFIAVSELGEALISYDLVSWTSRSIARQGNVRGVPMPLRTIAAVGSEH
ncbi:MAG: hypothetical protein V4773_17250, partial [Verrucomicrobiota bacterium]